ncbi:hypothetical protein [Microbulbifer sp.]|uniref:phage terminase large subunit family protein n=1 Tax=Microbulbifer sp. TaxID=1908541 RepID=UPI00258779ED|nr:hypothetical protein [Microbulbifer sp.]
MNTWNDSETDYFIGVDLGQSHDPTAIAVIEREKLFVRETAKGKLELKETSYNLRHLERRPLGESYVLQVAYVASLLRRPPFRDRVPVYIDYTGVGRPVFDLFEDARVPGVIGVTITGGKEIKPSKVGVTVPKVTLVSKVQAELHAGRLKISGKLPDAPVLVKELQDFRVSYTQAGNATFNAREGAHDDLVLALAIALFGATQPQPAMDINIRMAF